MGADVRFGAAPEAACALLFFCCSSFGERLCEGFAALLVSADFALACAFVPGFLPSLVLLPARLLWGFFSPAGAGILSSVVLIGLFFKFTVLSVLFYARMRIIQPCLKTMIVLLYHAFAKFTKPGQWPVFWLRMISLTHFCHPAHIINHIRRFSYERSCKRFGRLLEISV
ncbi:hypothetical protein AALG83_02605 [Christensenellaceae bacterium 44-20]